MKCMLLLIEDVAWKRRFLVCFKMLGSGCDMSWGLGYLEGRMGKLPGWTSVSFPFPLRSSLIKLLGRPADMIFTSICSLRGESYIKRKFWAVYHFILYHDLW